MAVTELDERDWTRLISQLRAGKCTPFLGAGACATLPTGTELSRTWAEKFGYPFSDEADLARVMQFGAISYSDAVYVKEKVCAQILEAKMPDFTDPAEPHALLAEFPLPLFVTTNYDEFLGGALERAGKSPQWAMCPWNFDSELDYQAAALALSAEPTKDAPLIYHLHGMAREPESIVLTERDYLEFLVRLVRSRDESKPPILPSLIASALVNTPLLFIGYSMQDWTFKVLFYGLLRDRMDINKRRSISVQIKPALSESAQQKACEFLSKYFDGWNIQIFWGSAAQFCHELRSRMNGSTS
jgi:hypothetical protein